MEPLWVVAVVFITVRSEDKATIDKVVDNGSSQAGKLKYDSVTSTVKVSSIWMYL
jgi:hypothetical protein